MNDFIETKGIILRSSNLKEYDKRLQILTSDRGKITVFANGVRRPNSKFLAACSPFSFGEIRIFPGKNAYTLLDFSVKDYFEELRRDFEASCMGMYFLEVADYYCVENGDELKFLKLLYAALKNLEKIVKKEKEMRLGLARIAFEIKAIEVNGEFPGVPSQLTLSPAAVSALNFFRDEAPEGVFSFKASEQVEEELERAACIYRQDFLKGDFKSLQLL